MSSHHGPGLARLHRAALFRYMHGGVSSGKAHLEVELASLERSLMVLPRGYRNGLITADEARAAATPKGLVDLDALTMPVCPRIGDDFKVIPEREWSDAIVRKRREEAENRGLVKFSLDQGPNGSCAPAGIAGCTMFCEEKQAGPVKRMYLDGVVREGLPALTPAVELLNELGLYGYVNGGRDGGSSLSDCIAAARRYGIPSERVWPRSNGWRTPLSDEAKQDALRHRPDEVYRVANKLEFGTALLLGFVVYCGYPGHAFFAVDLIDILRFRWKNSWGSEWADDGFSTLRFSEVQESYGMWAVRTARRASVRGPQFADAV